MFVNATAANGCDATLPEAVTDAFTPEVVHAGKTVFVDEDVDPPIAGGDVEADCAEVDVVSGMGDGLAGDGLIDDRVEAGPAAGTRSLPDTRPGTSHTETPTMTARDAPAAVAEITLRRRPRRMAFPTMAGASPTGAARAVATAASHSRTSTSSLVGSVTSLTPLTISSRSCHRHRDRGTQVRQATGCLALHVPFRDRQCLRCLRDRHPDPVAQNHHGSLRAT